MEAHLLQINSLLFKLQAFITYLVGCVAASRVKLIKSAMINWVIKRYKVDLTEAKHTELADYTCFNDFFTRKLRDGARPIDVALNSIVSPADGFVSQYGSLRGDLMIQAKGIDYSLPRLLADSSELCADFTDGHYACIYLSPRDYHRVHMPCAGHLVEMTYIPGSLYSVQPKTVNKVADLFAKNERLVCLFETADGPMIVVLVGAMIVASIHTVWHGPVRARPLAITRYDYSDQEIYLKKGAELGHFQMGSTVIALFNHQLDLNWSADVRSGEAIRMGQVMAHQVSSES